MSKKSSVHSCVFLACLFAVAAPCSSEVFPHALFSDNMVIQQGCAVTVWGTADPDEQVSVTLGDRVAGAKTDQSGNWRVRFDPMTAGGPHILTIEGKNKLSYQNVMIGEVWVCSGQSNMQWSVKASAQSDNEIAAADHPNIRLFTVPRVVASKPQTKIEGAWSPCTPQTIGDFSAVAYFFGRELHQAIKTPVGLIHTSWGGTPAEAWTSMAVLQAEPRFKSILDLWQRRFKDYPTVLDAHVRDIETWRKAADAAEDAGKPLQLPKLEFPADPRINSHRPAGLYNGMIHPLLPYGIKGAIWYQGESNAGRAYQYRSLFPAMIQNWRKDWGLGDFPFLFVQLAPFGKIVSTPQESAWAELREAQLLTSQTLSNTAMAVIMDVGDPDDIHPKKKQPVGARLALAARALGYSEKTEYSGPVYKEMKRDGSKIVVSFNHLGGGLVAKEGPLKGFSIAGADKKFVNATADIVGDSVVVSSPLVADPVAVRYGWADCPVVNLWSKADLPASPFRTDDFPMLTATK